MRTSVIKKCKDLNEDFFAQDWFIDLFLAKEGMIALQENSYIELGKDGVSRSNPFKPFQNYAIEFFFPFYSFHKKINSLIFNFSFKDKLYFKFKVYSLHILFFKLRAFGFLKTRIKT